MKKLTECLTRIALLPTTTWLCEVETQAPLCCDKKAVFTGHHQSLLGETLFYQCSICRTVFPIANMHRGISLLRLWRMIFTPNSGPKGGDENVSL